MRLCQSCGMPIRWQEDLGTNRDDTKNEEYCIHCYQHGKYTQEITMAEQIAKTVQMAIHSGIDEEEARLIAENTIPSLKRWKK